MPKTPCYHVTTVKDAIYGVAATSKRDAMAMVAERIVKDGDDDAPRIAERVGTWEATYGTVILY